MKILWIALVWPEPGSSAAGCRTTQLVEALQSAGHRVEVCSPCRPNPYQERLEAQGIPTASYKPNDSAFDSYISELKPEIVFFDRFMAEEQFGWRVKACCPDAIRILDTIDLHSLRRTRQAAVANLPAELLCESNETSQLNLYTEDAIREISSIYRSDLSLIISSAEFELLQNHYRVPAELIKYCPLFYNTPKTPPDFESRKNIIAIGNFNHEPNCDSYRVLHQTLWSRIRSKLCEHGQGQTELHIYGAYPTKEFQSLDNPTTGFRVKGWAEDSFETLKQYRVNLAPLRFGAGLKGKIADGWAVGTPCVGTSIAAEGMHQPLGFGGFVEDNVENFIERAALLYTQPDLWREAKERGVRIIKKLFDKEQHSADFIRYIESSVAECNSRRQQNFVGAMLWHHQHRSTEFFSRWIEMKSRLAVHESFKLPAV